MGQDTPSENKHNQRELSSVSTDRKDSNPSKDADSDSSSSSSEYVEERASEVEFEQKTSPYHLIGALCFCSAIVVGIACITASSLLLGDIPNNILRWIFGGLMGGFFFFLFLCLCCTYYLGASKESWETPTFSGIRKNFSNFVALAGLIVEFIQICSFSFNRTTLFGGVAIYYINYTAVPVEENNSVFEIIYWIMFAIAFTPYVFVIVIRIIIYVYTIKEGETSAASIVDKFQERIHSVLWFLVNVFYFPIIGTMVSGTDCTYTDSSITLDSNHSIQCLTGKHIAIVVCSMLALIIYYPAASFAQAQTQSISDIKFKPRIVFVMLQGKFLLVLIAVFFTQRLEVYFTALLLINLLFLILNVWGQPCLVNWVNRMRTVLFAMSLWASIVNLLMAYAIPDGQNSIIPPILLLVVWGVMIIGFPIFFLIWDRLHQKEESLPK